MPLWGNNDSSGDSVLSAPAQVKQEPNTANRDALYQNTTANGYGTNETIGQYGVDVGEMRAARLGGTRRTPHAGWVLRKVGTGGRANRVQEECLVAFGSLSGDDLTVTVEVDTDVNATTLLILSTGSTQDISLLDLVVNSSNTAVINTDVSARVASIVNTTAFTTNVDIVVANGTADIVLRNADDVAFPDYYLFVVTNPSDASGNSADDEIVTFTVVGGSTPTGATLSYGWQIWDTANAEYLDLSDAGAYSNTDTATMSVLANTAADGEIYRAVVQSANGGAVNAYSSNATLTVTS